jgi:hypothetical protein
MRIRGDITAITLILAGLVSQTATAQSIKVQSTSLARMSQMLRSNGTVDAARVFTQRVRLSVYDATGSNDGRLNVHLSFRYSNDFGLVDHLKDDAVADMYWNQAVLDEAYLQWRPFTPINLRAGRFLRLDALGPRDIDGISLQLEPILGKGVSGRIEVWAGRDVFFETSALSGEAWDIQGVPEDSQAGSADWTLSGGVRAGLHHRSAGVEIAWLRRVYSDAEGDYLGEERVGAAMHGQITDDLNIVSRASYHTVLADVDRASLLAAWRTGPVTPTLSLGLERIVPWFDTGSIFNLFGAQPYEGGWFKVSQPIAALNSEIDVRSFGRIYEGDQDLVDFGKGSADATTWGLGMGHDTRFSLFEHPFTWRSVGTYSDSIDDAYGGARALIQTMLSVEAVRDVFIQTRGLWLWANPSNDRYKTGTGVTGTLGLEWRTELGRLSAVVESSQTTFQGGNLQAFLSFDVEVWP